MADSLSSIADYLARRRDAVLASWREMASIDARLTTADRLTRTQFNDHIPQALDALDWSLRGGGPMRADNAAEHGTHRWQQGYALAELVRELGYLHVCLLRELHAYLRAGPAADPDAVATASERIAGLLHEIVTASVCRYQELQQADAAGRVRALTATVAEFGEGNKARGEALRAASHDLRGGLSVVALSAALLELRDLPDGRRGEVVRRLQRGLASLGTMLNDLADLARLEAGQERREVAPFDAAVSLADLCSSVLPMAEAKGITLRGDGPAALPVDGDVGRVQRVAQNLLINAVKYTAAGGVVVTWGTESTGSWWFSVADTGPGMPGDTDTPVAAELADASTPARSAGGEGIGLSIVKRLCELLDAGLECDAPAGGGTTFRVTLPRHYQPTA
jgi:signal transduction histidine kinase